jgi:hypothetical protein
MPLCNVMSEQRSAFKEWLFICNNWHARANTVLHKIAKYSFGKITKYLSLQCMWYGFCFQLKMRTIYVCYPTIYPHIPRHDWGIYQVKGRECIFPADISLCSVLAAIISQLFPLGGCLICGHRDFAIVLEADNIWAMNFLDVITFILGAIVTNLRHF